MANVTPITVSVQLDLTEIVATLRTLADALESSVNPTAANRRPMHDPNGGDGNE